MQSVRSESSRTFRELPGDQWFTAVNATINRFAAYYAVMTADGELMLLALAMIGKVLRRTIAAQIDGYVLAERPARFPSSTSIPCHAEPLRPKCFHTNRCASSCGHDLRNKGVDVSSNTGLRRIAVSSVPRCLPRCRRVAYTPLGPDNAPSSLRFASARFSPQTAHHGLLIAIGRRGVFIAAEQNKCDGRGLQENASPWQEGGGLVVGADFRAVYDLHQVTFTCSSETCLLPAPATGSAGINSTFRPA